MKYPTPIVVIHYTPSVPQARRLVIRGISFLVTTSVSKDRDGGGRGGVLGVAVMREAMHLSTHFNLVC